MAGFWNTFLPLDYLAQPEYRGRRLALKVAWCDMLCHERPAPFWANTEDSGLEGEEGVGEEEGKADCGPYVKQMNKLIKINNTVINFIKL